MTFPKLKTGAVAQYPARKKIVYRTEVLRFVDGVEQRYRLAGRAQRRWSFVVRCVDESEAGLLQQLYRGVQGGHGTFDFEDPWDGVSREGCSFVRDDFEILWEAEGRARIELELTEKRA